MKRIVLALMLSGFLCGCSLSGFVDGFKKGATDEKTEAAAKVAGSLFGPLGVLGVVLAGGLGYGIYLSSKEGK